MPNIMMRSDVEIMPSALKSYMALALVTGCIKYVSKVNRSLRVMFRSGCACAWLVGVRSDPPSRLKKAHESLFLVDKRKYNTDKV